MMWLRPAPPPPPPASGKATLSMESFFQGASESGWIGQRQLGPADWSNCPMVVIECARGPDLGPEGCGLKRLGCVHWFRMGA